MLMGITRKNHIPDGPQYHEKYYFVPGNTGYPVYETAYGKIGVGICWDEWYLARILSLQNVNRHSISCFREITGESAFDRRCR